MQLVSQEQLLLGKAVFHIRQKGVPPLLLPASVLQLPRCLVRICNFDSYCFTLFELHGFKKCNCIRENLLQNSLLRKCGLLAHTSAAFLKNCCTEKLFSLPAALIPATKNPDRTITSDSVGICSMILLYLVSGCQASFCSESFFIACIPIMTTPPIRKNKMLNV